MSIRFYAVNLRSLLCAMALASFTQQALAQNYPTRPVTIVVPYAAGGGTDVVARLVAQRLSEQLHGSFVVENQLGAGGLIASRAVAKAVPDGYTLLMATNAQLAIQVTLRKTLPYDPTKDFVPIAMTGDAPFGLIVNSSLPVRSVSDLIRLAKEKPGKLSFGSSGTGGVPHLLGELFMSMTGTKMVHIPYKGNTQALSDIAAGRVSMIFSGLVPAMGLLKSGQVRVLGVTSQQRVPVLPDVPPIADTVPGFEAVAWLMLIAPSGTPKPVVEKLHRAVTAIVQLPESRKRYTSVGYVTPEPLSQKQLTSFLKSEIKRWGKIVAQAGLTRSQ